jgi:hypothetical protein
LFTHFPSISVIDYIVSWSHYLNISDKSIGLLGTYFTPKNNCFFYHQCHHFWTKLVICFERNCLHWTFCQVLKKIINGFDLAVCLSLLNRVS